MENNVKSQHNNIIAHINPIETGNKFKERKFISTQFKCMRRDANIRFEANSQTQTLHYYILKREYYQPNAAKPADVYHSVERYVLSVTVLDAEGI